jgi:hypothetical protein
MEAPLLSAICDEEDSTPEGLDFRQDDDTAAKDTNTKWSSIFVLRIVTYIQLRAVHKQATSIFIFISSIGK